MERLLCSNGKDSNMDKLAERVEQIEAQIWVLNDEKFDYKCRNRELEMKLSQSEERIKELEKNIQKQCEEAVGRMKKVVFKKLKRRVKDLEENQQQLLKQDEIKSEADNLRDIFADSSTGPDSSLQLDGTENSHDDSNNEPSDANETRLHPLPSRNTVQTRDSNEAVNDDGLSFERDESMKIDGGNWLVQYDCRDFRKRLFLPGNPQGTFLITEETKDKSSHVLSVRDTDDADGNPIVKSYRIYRTDDDEANYFIFPNKMFSSLVDIVSHHQGNSHGLCCTLTVPCPRIPLSELEISRRSIQLHNKLDGAYFSETWRGTLHGQVDVDVVRRADDISSEDFLNEAKMLHRLRHHKVVKLLAVQTSEEPFFIITELMINGTLLSLLRSEKGNSLSFDSLIAFNLQISEGMSYLEKVNVVHRDLRAFNILVGEDFEVKLAGFSLSRVLEDGEYVQPNKEKLPLKWTAPEVFTAHKFSSKSDVWSFGVLMYEIITLGKTPYPGMTFRELVDKVRTGWRMEKPTNRSFEVPDYYFGLMLKCWRKNPEERPTFQSLHDIFDDYYTYSEPDYEECEIELTSL